MSDPEHQFFDLREDPWQRHDLAGTGAQPGIAAALRAQVLSWNAATPWLDHITDHLVRTEQPAN